MTDRYTTYLDKLRSNDGLRRLRDVQHEGTNIRFDGHTMLNLSSNDYMGIGSDTTLWREFLDGESHRDDFGGSACSSRLLTGNHTAYMSLERKLSSLYGTEAALVFESGYHANIGILPAVSTSKDLILADKLVHASIIDGIRLSVAECVRFPHNDMERLEAILEKRRQDFDNVFIVTESVFSMDGDCADLKKLVELKRKYDAMLYVDEAHAVGVRGAQGLGLCEEVGVTGDVDFLVGTFGKAVASQGAFVATNGVMYEYLVNTMRPLIFSTALPPISVRWTEYVIDHLATMNDKRLYLRQTADILRDNLKTAGLETCGESNIVPLIVRDNTKAVKLSAYLCENGFFVLPIRTPTVPAGSERLRISLTAAVTREQIEKLSELCRHTGH